MNWKSILIGIAGLALFQGVVSSKKASSNVGGWLASAGKAAEWFLSPTVPAFTSAASGGSGSSSKGASGSPSSGGSSSGGTVVLPPAIAPIGPGL